MFVTFLQWVFELGTEEGKKKKVHWKHWEDTDGQVGCTPPLRMHMLPLPVCLSCIMLPSSLSCYTRPPHSLARILLAACRVYTWCPHACLRSARCPIDRLAATWRSIRWDTPAGQHAQHSNVGGGRSGQGRAAPMRPHCASLVTTRALQDFTFLTIRSAGHEAPYTGKQWVRVGARGGAAEGFTRWQACLLGALRS